MKHVVTCCALVSACSDRPPPVDSPPSIEVTAFRALPRHELDLLFVVDDSPAAAALPALGDYVAPLYDVLSTLDPPSYDLHVGVVTGDLGTTGSLDPAHAAPAVGACADAGDDGVLVAPFLADALHDDGSRVTTAPGSPLTVLATQLATGHAGCELQQHTRALHRALTQPANAGFLRSTAALGVILVGTQDDCSVRDATMFTTPLQPYRCTTEGLRCDQPLDSAGAKAGCTAREDSTMVAPIAPIAQFLVDMKGDARSVMVATLTAPPVPVTVEARGSGLGLAPACSFVDTSGALHAAFPAVRDAALLAALPGAAIAQAAPCQENLAPAFAQIARAVKTTLGDPCIDTTDLHDDDVLTPGIQPFCGVEDVRDGGDPPAILPRCPSASGDCFELVSDPRVCPATPEHLRVRITRAAPPEPGVWTHVHCSVR